jgi:hypothetical protein
MKPVELSVCLALVSASVCLLVLVSDCQIRSDEAVHRQHVLVRSYYVVLVRS